MIVKKELPFILSMIQPQVPPPSSDRYSRNLHNWLRTYGKRLGAAVWCMQQDHEGKPLPFHFEHGQRSDIYIGLNDGMINGSAVRDILLHNFMPLARSAVGALDITDWFWKEYIKRGRCLMDPEHTGVLTNGGERFELRENQHRVCRWCGLSQKLEVKEVIVKREKWVNLDTWYNAALTAR